MFKQAELSKIFSLGQIIKTTFKNVENLLKDLMSNKDQIKEDDKKNSITLFHNKKRANYYRDTYEEEIKKERAISCKKNEIPN